MREAQEIILISVGPRREPMTSPHIKNSKDKKNKDQNSKIKIRERIRGDYPQDDNLVSVG